ncbi:IclR family transcriptional regulator [Caproiciproducens sp. NJN-50]|uniref:IclR family transcriptional regulator n=1 Tax=Acutalibacteraceae TaxID=3082771 RepID=UPI000FFE2910|nr:MULTISPECIES: IclR family transcriptional regulator [Acutalibacteraceae]QAT48489.1 IclR family transcriptional regulator [Caproiciproducens sp. NJN-50]
MKKELSERNGSSGKNQSVEKVFLILETMASCREPVQLRRLAELTGCPPSTAIRFLRTLMKLGYVRQDPESQKYFLTFRLCRLAGQIRDASPLNRIARPVMETLARRCGESVCLAVEQENRAVYVEVVDGPDHLVRSLQRIGSSSPLHCTGVGKLLLLNRSPEELDRFFREQTLTRFTKNTLTEPKAVLDALGQARSRGYTFDNEECEIGARCVAFPVRDFTGKIAAGLSVTGTVFHISDEFVRHYAPAIKAAADEISGILGYSEAK